MNHHQITKTQYKVSDFLSWQSSDSLTLSPSFQRRAVWAAGAKSFLIDTIIRGLPVPIIMLRDTRSNLRTLKQVREVVDGQQRLRTLISYIRPNLLPDYSKTADYFVISKSHNKDFAGYGFKDLPSDVRQEILDYQFSVHVFPSGVDDREILQIFARINSSGYKLNSQELRNAKYFGEFKTSMFTLAATELSRWRSWKIFDESEISRMQEVELTSELIQLMLVGIRGKSQDSLNKLYLLYDEDFPSKSELERRFAYIMNSLDIIGDVFSEGILGNRPIFFALFAAVYDYSFGINSKLKRIRPAALTSSFKKNAVKASERLSHGSLPASLAEALERRTTNPLSRKQVYDFMKQTLFRD